QDQVQTDVAGLREQLQEPVHGVGRTARDQVVVVDEDEHLRARPPAAGAQLIGGDVGSGQALLEGPGDPAEQLGGGARRGDVAGEAVLVDLAEQ
ncbi:MAG TPA: hypothetical protein VGF17_10700, partial [Phytomonospora sp.]